MSLSNKVLSKENKEILIIYPSAFEIKYVWIPNIKIPTKLLIKLKNFAPLKPRELLKITAKGKPCFWDGVEIKLIKKYTSKEPKRVPIKTTKEFKLYTKYKEVINEKAIMLWIFTPQ